MEQRKTIKPPSSISKDFEEKRLGIALSNIRQTLIKPYLQLKTEQEKKIFEEEHPETHIAIGIVDEDGEETYIENGVNLVSVLKVKKDGRYRVFIENQGTKKAIAGGYYWVETEK